MVRSPASGRVCKGCLAVTLAAGLVWSACGRESGNLTAPANGAHVYAQMQHAGTITALDAPGAGTTAGQGTEGPGITPAATVTGFYFDGSTVSHGFVRDPDGSFTTFDAPGAGTAHVSGLQGTPAGVFGGQGTYSIAINPGAAITGFYYDGSSVAHGFLRTRQGTFTRLDAPGAGTGFGQGTFATNINAAGLIAGSYADASGVNHGFVRAPGGMLTTFDVPGAGTGSGQGTIALTNNPAGVITGVSIDQAGVVHGFVRMP